MAGKGKGLSLDISVTDMDFFKEITGILDKILKDKSIDEDIRNNYSKELKTVIDNISKE